jgi:uncharacterized membrane protein YedE/YeeE
LGWIEPRIPPFVWQANLIGGLMFGVGMVVAATCITGVFYKLGHGMLGMLVALAAWALGDILTYLGPLAPLRDSLRSAEITVDGQSATLLNAPGATGVVVLAILGIACAAYLWRSPRQSRGKLWNWALLGAVTGLFMSVAWLLARAGGSSYTFGTSGVPSTIFVALTEQVAPDSWWIPITLILVIPGAFIASKRAGTLWVRGETPKRYAQLAIGGFIMGVGAAIAGGCNLGHGMVGVSLLSLGSITSTVAIIIGVFLADRVLKLCRKDEG